jgi:peptidyl-tRNA hydrolase, PTH2 family
MNLCAKYVTKKRQTSISIMKNGKKSKQVLVWRKDLAVRKGKIGAQLAHASLAVFLNSMEKIEGQGLFEIKMRVKTDSPIYDWLSGKFTKICVYVENEKELIETYEKARVAGLPCSLIKDAGDTEFNGVPTLTCCAIGPTWEDEVNAITGKLKLL